MKSRGKWLVLAILSLMTSCASWNPEVASDSYCEVYVPIIVAPGDGTIAASRGVKERIAVNEFTYRRLCGAVP